MCIRDRSYLYGDERFPYALTGIVDSAGINYASWKYNAGALAIESTLADGLDKYTIDRFFGSGRLEVNFVVTNPLGRQTNITPIQLSMMNLEGLDQ